MKKLLTLAIALTFSFNCMASLFETITIQNQSGLPVKVNDADDNWAVLERDESKTLKVRLHKQYNDAFPLANSEMPRAAKITVTVIGSETMNSEKSNTTTVDDDTKRLIIKNELQLIVE